jgi:DNA-binding response OmpR family regulator
VTTKRVLIVDDDIGIRRIVQLTLQTIANWDVLLASSGSEGVAIAETELPDAILLDVMMPGMDGMETFVKIQANPITKTIPIILLTAKTKVNEQQHFNNIAIAGVITKPFNAPQLVDQIRSILNWNT